MKALNKFPRYRNCFGICCYRRVAQIRFLLSNRLRSVPRKVRYRSIICVIGGKIISNELSEKLADGADPTDFIEPEGW